MLRSYAECVTLSCPEGHTYEALAWRVIDASEHPDLLTEVVDGSIAMPACTKCGRRDAIIVESLLLFFPGRDRPLIFSPMIRLSPEKLQQEVDGYVGYLQSRLGAEWREAWTLGGLPVIARDKLPAFLESYLRPDRADLQQVISETLGLHESHQRSGNPAVLDLALAGWERAIRNAQFSDADVSVRLLVYSMLADEYRVRYADRGDDHDFERAAEVLQSARELDDGTRAPQLEEVAGLLQLARYLERKDEAALFEAVLRLDAALEGLQDGVTPVPLLLNAGHAWSQLFNVVNTAEALDRAISLLRRAAADAPAGSSLADQARNRLGDALDKRHQRFGRIEDLDEGEALFTAVIGSSHDVVELAAAYNGRGCILLDRFTRLGKIGDLHRALPDLERALEVLPADSRNLAAYWIDLGNARRSSYEVEGDMADLEAAIQAQTHSAEVSRMHGLNPNVALINIGILASMRYSASGRISDLSEAVGHLQTAAKETAEGSQQEAQGKITLVNLLCARYARTADGTDLNDAIGLIESVLAAKIVPEPLRPSALQALGVARLLDYRRRRDAIALDAAIEALDEACNSPAASEMIVPSACGAYAAALAARHDLLHEPADVERAITMARRGTEHIPPDSPRRSELVGVLAQCLEKHAVVVGDERLHAEAVALYREASQKEANPPGVLVNASRWAQMHFSRGDWQRAAEPFERALAARGELLSMQTLRSEKEAWLIEVQGLSTDAAYTFAKTGDVAMAAVTLENGVAILLSEALGLASRDVDRLRAAGQGELAMAYGDAAERWRAVSRLPLAAGLQLSDAALTRQMEEARAEFAAVVEKIRCVPGFAGFRMPTSIGELQRIAAQFGAPIVYLAVTRYGSLAVLVTGESARAIWPKFTRAQLAGLLAKQGADGLWGGYLAAQLGLNGLLEPALAEVLPVLRDELVAPVRAELEQLGCEKVALVLTGQLALLPVSAALVDGFCVQVEANGRSLGVALAEAERRSDRSTVLAIGNPLPSARPLPAAEMEAAVVAARFRKATLMRGAAVERRKVTEGLATASHLHFACHGNSAPEDALASSLSLGGNERLTVRDLLFGGSMPQRARLVVLSACQSAIPDFTRLPDEVVGLPVAFLQAGVPGVVGTLWPVSDLSTALLMDRFYRSYVDKAMPPGIALRAAQQWLRSAPASELAEHFRTERQKSDEARTAPYEVVSAAWRRFAALDPASTPFAPATYWAAFVYYGA